MLRIRLDLYRFSGFLELSVICALFVCAHRESANVFDCSSMLDNRDGSVLVKTDMLIPRVSFSYCESESQAFPKNPIQNP
jgi:hypothetical protein